MPLKSMNPLDLIRLYYRPGSMAYEVLVRHCEAVAAAAVSVARQVPDLASEETFIHQAAMLHDIGIFQVHAPEIGCFGKDPYVCHGWRGARILKQHGLPRHARVCERHVGIGLTAGDIASQGLPLPGRDMCPETMEEQIICYADLFFSKMPPPEGTRRDAAGVIAALAPRGAQKVEQFVKWQKIFGSIP